MVTIETLRGAKVQVHPAPHHLGEGLVLTLRMVNPSDKRTASVYLDPATIVALIDALQKGGVDVQEG